MVLSSTASTCTDLHFGHLIFSVESPKWTIFAGNSDIFINLSDDRFIYCKLYLAVMDELFETLKQGDRLGNYQIVCEIGRGGMSRVYKAKYLVTNEDRALKVLPPNSSDERVNALKWEAEIGRVIGEHPNIVRVYEDGEQNGWAYLSMELVNGESLASLIKRGVKPGVRRSLEIATNVACGLEYIHGRNIFHADITPGNILLNDHVKITDFGIAYDSNRKLPECPKEIVMGTLYYIAPERVDRNGPSEPDARSEIYSLGATLYFALTGATPFECKSDKELLIELSTSKPLSPAQRIEGINPLVDLLCRKAMGKHPNDRFQSARAFVDAANTVLNSSI